MVCFLPFFAMLVQLPQIAMQYLVDGDYFAMDVIGGHDHLLGHAVLEFHVVLLVGHAEVVD